MSQWCLCFVCPCATYLPRRWKSFRREPPSCPRAAGKPWLLRDLGQMLPRKRQKRRNLADFCADPGRKWPWYAKEAIQIDTFDTVSWNGPTYLWVCQTCWIEINTNIHAHSSLGKCLSRVFFQRKKAYVSLTLGPEDGCAFCVSSSWADSVCPWRRVFHSGLQKQKLLPTILAPWHLLSDWERLLRHWILIIGWSECQFADAKVVRQNKDFRLQSS